MMEQFFFWLAGLLTLSGMAYFILGFLTSHVLYYVSMSIKHRRAYVNWRHSGIVLGIAVILFVSLQTQTAYNLAKKTAVDSAACQVEFNRILKARSQISEENDSLSREQRTLLVKYNSIQNLMWVRLLSPPPPFDKMETSDPMRQAYGLSVVTDVLKQTTDIEVRTSEIEKRQKQLSIDRAAHPLPEPTCGK